MLSSLSLPSNGKPPMAHAAPPLEHSASEPFDIYASLRAPAAGRLVAPSISHVLCLQRARFNMPLPESIASRAAARASLPDPPAPYPFKELAAATNNFLAKRVGSSASAYWRCSLRGRDAALFQLPVRPGASAADAAALARVGRYHHARLARLLGACPAGAHVYLAYELPPGAATLAACLRASRCPGFTALCTWASRVQVAADVAQGLEYIHHHAGAVHGRVSPAAVIVSDPGHRARLTHFGAAEFAAAAGSPYAGEPSREADVYAFGVLLLELLSGC
ncbi:hypothetical protein ACP70R_041610 [Stipagrostis hirtigluma subsp. patula]